MTKYIITTLLMIITLFFAYTKVQDHKIKALEDKVAQHPTEIFDEVQKERKSNYEKAIDINNSLDGNTTYWVQ